MSNSHTPESLVKYETPILVSSGYKSGTKGGKSLPAIKTGAPQTTEDFLNMILPPQEIVDNNQLWVRYVSATPATTADVTNLQKDLDKRNIQMEARDSGICPIREELFAQAFDELIRQITINCAERGHLLLRVRDEIRMYKETLQGLYDSSIAYGLKKALVAEQTKKDMH
jgi:dynein light intermediate chain